MKVRIRKAAVVAALCLPLALGACSSGDDAAAPNGAQTTAAAESGPFAAQPGTEVDKDAFLDETQKAMLAKGTYAMQMTMAMQGQQMKVNGVGDMSDQQNLKVRMTMEMPGASGQGINMLLIGKTMYMQLPGQAGGKYVQVPIETLAQSGGQDFERLLNPAESLQASKESVQNVTYVGEEDVNGTQLKHYRLTMDLTAANQAAGITPTANPTGPQTVPYDVWVDGEKLMRQMKMSVEGTDVTVVLDKYGEPADISAPPSASVTTMPGLSGGGSAPTATASPTS
ncbi:LppX_LprAFG lipoprotein [Piscicoccus intestinalis]|uniref:LppX_LprAFG lipoprotein n=1 Tax=Piscicoccus intestinalis TaxID=746033 RepID=UPI000838D8CE|nr:LppX_LprAFG lipoprotein [Piscicoccus intestinalis]